VVGAQVPQVLFALVVQVVDEGQGRGDIAEPRLGQRQTPKQLAAAGAEQVADRTGLAEGQQGGVVTLSGPASAQMPAEDPERPDGSVRLSTPAGAPRDQEVIVQRS
jgi:hypothetical protein